MKRTLLFSLIILIYTFLGSCKQLEQKGIFPIVNKPLSDPFPPAQTDLIDSFILAYDRNTIKEFMDGTSSLKGLYIDDKLISIIRDPKYKDLKGLYLYFGKRIKDRKLPINASDRFHDGKYTIIAIPSLPSINNPGKDSLIVSESLEWHDPISSHIPTNEQEIGY